MNYIQYMQAPFQPIGFTVGVPKEQQASSKQTQKALGMDTKAYKDLLEKAKKEAIEKHNKAQLERNEIAYVINPKTRQKERVYNPSAGYLSGTDPLVKAVLDVTPVGDAETIAEASNQAAQGNLKAAGTLIGVALLPNVIGANAVGKKVVKEGVEETTKNAIDLGIKGQLDDIVVNSAKVATNPPSAKAFAANLANDPEHVKRVAESTYVPKGSIPKLSFSRSLYPDVPDLLPDHGASEVYKELMRDPSKYSIEEWISKGVNPADIPVKHSLPPEVIEQFQNSVFPRRLDLYEPFERQLLQTSGQVGRMPVSAYYEVTPEAIGISSGVPYRKAQNTLGRYNPVTNTVYVQTGRTPDVTTKSIAHEVRHALDGQWPLSEQELSYLVDAYGNNFADYAYQKRYKNILKELVTTNQDIRLQLLGQDAVMHMPLDKQNQLIQNASDADIIKAVKTSNDYGYTFLQNVLQNEGSVSPEQIQAIKTALQKVGMAGLPLTIGSQILNTETQEHKNGGILNYLSYSK